MKRPIRTKSSLKTAALQNNKPLSKRPDGKRAKAGRPAHVPDDWHRSKVTTFASVGYNEEQIAGYLKISSDTLHKYYRRELAYATMDMLGVAKKGLALALKEKKPWAICFVLKTRGRKLHNGEGWLERTEITGANGKALIPEIDITKLTDEQLIKLREAQSLLASIAPALTTGTRDSAESD